MRREELSPIALPAPAPLQRTPHTELRDRERHFDGRIDRPSRHWRGEFCRKFYRVLLVKLYAPWNATSLFHRNAVALVVHVD